MLFTLDIIELCGGLTIKYVCTTQNRKRLKLIQKSRHANTPSYSGEAFVRKVNQSGALYKQ